MKGRSQRSKKTPSEPRTVLVTDGGSGQGRSALAAVRALGVGGYRAIVTTSGGRSLAAASRWCTGSVAAPPVNSRGYADAVRRAATGARALTILPASDAALLALDAPVAHLVDKAALADRAIEAGLATPPSLQYGDADHFRAAVAKGAVSLPVVLKPIVSRHPARLVTSVDDLARLADHTGEFLMQPFVEDRMWAVAGVAAGGRALAAVQQRYLRTWPVPCGTASAAVTVEVDEYRLSAVIRLLDGYEGIFQAQFIGEMLIDVNPRVYGSLPLAVASGVNLPAIWGAWLEHRRRPSLPRGRVGVRYRWVEGDIRHLLSGVGSRRLSITAAVAALTPRKGTAHSVETLSDPGPMVARLRYAARRQGSDRSAGSIA